MPIQQSDIDQAIAAYFPIGVPANTAKYYVTEQYRRLMDRRYEAELTLSEWHAKLDRLRARITNEVSDQTGLATENCYEAVVILSELSIDPPSCLIAHIFCSLLIPAAYVLLEQGKLVSLGDYWPDGMPPADRKIISPHCETLNSIKSWLADEGYDLLGQEVHRSLEDIELEIVDNTTYFKCLFAPFAIDWYWTDAPDLQNALNTFCNSNDNH